MPIGIQLLLLSFLSLLTMNRAKSLLISESAFFSAATASVTDQERHHSSSRRGGLARRYSSFNLSSTSSDNDLIIAVAKNFLSTTCPELLTILENHYDEKRAHDRLVKIGRNVNATLRKFHVNKLGVLKMKLNHRCQYSPLLFLNSIVF